MKTVYLSISIAIASLVFCGLSSCGNIDPQDENQFVMMRHGDIQLQKDYEDRQKHIDNPGYRLNIIRFFRELFSPNKPKPSTPLAGQHSGK